MCSFCKKKNDASCWAYSKSSSYVDAIVDLTFNNIKKFICSKRKKMTDTKTMGCIILWFLVQGDTHHYSSSFVSFLLFFCFCTMITYPWRSWAFSQKFCIFSDVWELSVRKNICVIIRRKNMRECMDEWMIWLWW